VEGLAKLILNFVSQIPEQKPPVSYHLPLYLTVNLISLSSLAIGQSSAT
jgi:hypothetical protein